MAKSVGINSSDVSPLRDPAKYIPALDLSTEEGLAKFDQYTREIRTTPEYKAYLDNAVAGASLRQYLADHYRLDDPSHASDDENQKMYLPQEQKAITDWSIKALGTTSALSHAANKILKSHGMRGVFDSPIPDYELERPFSKEYKPDEVTSAYIICRIRSQADSIAEGLAAAKNPVVSPPSLQKPSLVRGRD